MRMRMFPYERTFGVWCLYICGAAPRADVISRTRTRSWFTYKYSYAHVRNYEDTSDKKDSASSIFRHVCPSHHLYPNPTIMINSSTIHTHRYWGRETTTMLNLNWYLEALLFTKYTYACTVSIRITEKSVDKENSCVYWYLRTTFCVGKFRAGVRTSSHGENPTAYVCM